MLWRKKGGESATVTKLARLLSAVGPDSALPQLEAAGFRRSIPTTISNRQTKRLS